MLISVANSEVPLPLLYLVFRIGILIFFVDCAPSLSHLFHSLGLVQSINFCLSDFQFVFYMSLWICVQFTTYIYVFVMRTDYKVFLFHSRLIPSIRVLYLSLSFFCYSAHTIAQILGMFLYKFKRREWERKMQFL